MKNEKNDKKANKRFQIFEATLDLIHEKGLQDSPMSSLAERANVGVGTIYRYFKNKDELLNELYKHLSKEVHEAMLMDYSEENSYEVRFRFIYLNLLNHYLDNPRTFRFIEQFIYSSYIMATTYDEVSSGSLAPMVDFFTKAKKDKAIKNVPIELIVSFIHGPIVTMVRQHMTGRIFIDESIKEIAVDSCWDSLKIDQ